jgi:hypothetical protein
MPSRRSEVLVTEFLRDALAVSALGVPELEARARATGLLGEGQSITHTKAFKRAKKFLRIRSLRAGFGARSQWRWQLPRQSESTIKTISGTAGKHRVAIPIDWLQGVARLNPDHPPNDVPRHRWRQFVDDCKKFLRPSENWAERAAKLGWDAMALFGCAPKRTTPSRDLRGSGAIPTLPRPIRLDYSYIQKNSRIAADGFHSSINGRRYTIVTETSWLWRR